MANPEWVTAEDPAARLAADLTSTRDGGVICIFSGEADPAAYNDPRVLKAMEDAWQRQVIIRAITGPVVAVDNDGFNGLLHFAKTGVVELRHRLARGTAEHFRVMETEIGDQLWSEFPHHPCLEINRHQVANLAARNPQEVKQLIEVARSVFDSWWERLQGMDRRSGVKYLPLLTTPAGVHELVISAERQRRVFNYLGPKELLSLPGHFLAAAGQRA